MESCIFCKIVNGSAPASIIYKDELISVIVPHNPFTIGHCLIIPNKHAESILELEENVMGKIAVMGQKIASAISNSEYISEGINLWLNDGKNAGQDIMHVHLHVFPRYEGDGFNVSFHSNEKNTDRNFLNSIAEELKMHLPE